VTTEEIIKQNSRMVLDKLAVKLIKRYHSGWEMDEYFWGLRDGRVFTTDHGKVVLFSKEELNNYIQEISEHLEKIKNI
jgi:hypothetical protein